ncbi:MAG: tetratricopeptide repeat protein, partial [Planctomycetota bacterium]|nr:tetratricopeptide repeat protein [Planctomycetota bacterium]
YRERLDAYVRHCLGELTDAQLEEQLKVKPALQTTESNRGAAHRSLAKTMLEKGDLEAARSELSKALEQDPTNVQARLDLADVQLRMGKLPECETLLLEVLKQTPDQPRASQLQMFLLVRQEQYVKAEPLLVAALATTPQPERIHAYLGLLYERTGKPDKAMEHYKAALNRTIRERF